MYRTAEVVVDNAAASFDKSYTYLVPQGMGLAPGQRVRIPFGRGNQKRTGLVLEMGTTGDHGRLKPVAEPLDGEPLLNEEGLVLLRYLKEQTFCTWFDAYRLLVPAGLGVRSKQEYRLSPSQPELEAPLTLQQQEIVGFLAETGKAVEEEKLCKKLGLTSPCGDLEELARLGVLEQRERHLQAVGDEKVLMVRRREDWREEPLSPKQKKVMEFLEENETASLKEICYYLATTRAVVDALVRKEAAEYYQQTFLRDPYEARSIETEVAPQLTPGQAAALESLSAMAAEAEPKPALLYGVTGAGKTQVFLRLIRQVLDRGRTVLVLVPEISLTAQTVGDFHSRFGATVAVLHSALSLGERMDQWRRIRRGEASIVVGTRSAVFAPLENLGLIVLDEEQEHTYKSDKSPRFHAREVARLRSRYHGAMLLLSSATPSVESYYHAKEGDYRLVELLERFNQAPLPDVYTVDMRESENLSANPAFSNFLLEELHYNLDHKEQSILLLNRRGYSTLVKCSGCGTVADCPNCSVAMTYHSANDHLLCHYCGYIQRKPQSCTHCGSSLIRYAGAGTQKVAEELEALYPGARILRVDMDTTMKKFSHQTLFGAFARREYDIMIGTQMVAKGLNFPDVTLVGVLNADQSLYSGDFRGLERSFSLLTQVVGRGGRGDRKGRAVIQTYSPDNPVIQLAARQDYPAFFRQEIQSRRLHLYPPFCAMAAVGFVGESLESVEHWSARFLEEFRRVARAEYPKLPVRVLGPSPSDILKAAGKYRYKLILKCRNTRETRGLLEKLLVWFRGECRQVHAFVDLHYDRL